MNFSNFFKKPKAKIEIKKEEAVVRENWGNETLSSYPPTAKPKKKLSLTIKFFLFSLIIFFVAIGILLFSTLNKANSFSEGKILISANAPATITSGEEGQLNVTVTNNNKIPIAEAYLTLTYDSGESFSGDKNIVNKRVEIGDILPRTSATKSFSFVVFGSEGSIQEMKAKLFYKVPNARAEFSQAEFNKESNSVSLALKTSPVSINANSLKEVHQNHPLDFEIIVKNNTSQTIKDLFVSARNPNDFVFASSSRDRYNNTSTWAIGDVPANSEKKILMSGKLIGDIGTSPKFTFYVGVSKENVSNDPNLSSESLNNFDNYTNVISNVYSKVEKSVLITGQYLDVSISSDNSPVNTPISPGSVVHLEFTYKNNLAFPIDNPVFSATLAGQAFDFDNIEAQDGYVDRNYSLIVWNSITDPLLTQIPAFGTGKLRMVFRVKDHIPETHNFRLIMNARGERNAEYGVSNDQDISLERVWSVYQN